MQDARQLRVNCVAARIVPAAVRQQITVQVLASDAPSAFSWPTGKVFVSRGLVDLLTDDELAAAIAHELGHLLGDGRFRKSEGATLVSLSGGRKDFDVESRADAIGVQLLRGSGLSESAMASMLTKVRDAGRLSESCQAALGRRVELLRAQ